MRRITAFNRVTADGYFASPDGGLDWAVPDEEIEQGAVGAMPDGDTILFGRRTYDSFEQFWPKAYQNPETPPDPHMPRRVSPAMRTMAVWINDANKIVFSRTRKEVTWNNSRLFHEFDPDAVRALKREPGKDMIIFGSGSIASELTRHGLIDEYQFIVTPILLGSGKSLISGLSSRTKLRLVEAKPYRTGNLMLRYERAT